jgi:endonuclease/exonuclease/phosphatase (EEP) superfamily protein YafD
MFRRILAAALIIGLGAALLVFAWPQLFGLQTFAGVAQIVALRGAAIAAVAVAAVLFLLLALAVPAARRLMSSLAIVCLAFIVLSSVVIASRGIGNAAFETANASDVTVLAWNTLGDAPGAQTVADLAIESSADIVVLPETTSEFGVETAALMTAAGSSMTPLTLAYDVISKARSTTVLISADLGAYTFDKETRTTSTLPTIVARPTDGTGPTIIAVHAVAPIPGELRNWRDDLEWLRDACAGDNIIMAGDFNATIDHMAGLGATREASIGSCLDAALASDNAAVGTWPTALPALAGSPIDHVMQTPNWRVTGMRVIETHDKFGSDHRPVVAQLSPAG